MGLYTDHIYLPIVASAMVDTRRIEIVCTYVELYFTDLLNSWDIFCFHMVSIVALMSCMFMTERAGSKRERRRERERQRERRRKEKEKERGIT